MENVTKHQFNVPLGESLEKILGYAKFKNELLIEKRKEKYHENISLTEEWSEIIQRKLPPKIREPCRFTIPCIIGKIKIDQALCDLGTNINLIPLAMLKKLDFGDVKTQMALTLTYQSLVYPYGVLKDMLVKMGDFLLPTYCIILDMEEDATLSLILWRPFLATGRA